MLRQLIVILFFSTCLQAQTPGYFQHFTEKDGLSSNQVRCILRDRNGWLWVGTEYGLNRYDGYTFRHYLPDSRQPSRSVSNEYINDIQEDSAGFIWIATYNGLNRFDPVTSSFRVWENIGMEDGSLPNSLVAGILPFRDQLWVNCDNRDPALFDPKTGVFKTFPWKKFVEKTLPEKAKTDYKTIWKIGLKSPDEIWLSTNMGLFSFQLTTTTFTWHAGYPAVRDEPGKKSACAGKKYFGSWENDIQCLNTCDNTWRRIPLPLSAEFRQGNRLIDVFGTGPNRILIGQQGMMMMNTATEKITRILPGPQNKFTAPTGNLTTYFQEPDGTTWIGGEGGVWRWDPGMQYFRYNQVIPEENKSIENAIYRVMDARSDGRRYILHVYQGQLLVFEKEQLIKTIQVGPLAAVLYEDRGGDIWVGGGKKLYQLDKKTLTPVLFPIPPEIFDPASKYYLSDMTQDATGNYWIATVGAGITVYIPAAKKWIRHGPETGIISRNISCLLADTTAKTIWLGTNDYGLYRYDELTRKFKLYRHDEQHPEGSLGAYIVRGITKDNKGYIWVSTDPGGISRFDYAAPEEKAFVTLDINNGLPSNRVFSIVTDQHNKIWAGSVKGLFCVDPESFQVTTFNQKDGIWSDHLDMPFSIGKNGEIFTGFKYGYQSFFPDSVLLANRHKSILFSSFKIYNREYIDSLNPNYLKRITLSWWDNFFSFQFSATDFSQPSRNSFAYRLVGFNDQWITCGPQREAVFTNVPPGEYTLEIKTGREGQWELPGRQLTIYIRAPFWKTWWFGIFLLCLVGAVIYTVFRYRTRQIQKEEALKTAFNQRIAQIEMTALRAQMNPHFVFNCLNSINRFILVNEPDEASAYLTKFSRLIRLILDNSREELIGLDQELEALKLYIELEAMRFNNRFDYEISLAPGLDTTAYQVPPMLIQPYVENAIWHGLMHRKEKGLLKIHLSEQSGSLHIIVEDNGIGRAKAAELKSKSAAQHKSQGMQVTAERMELIRTVYGVSASVQITDLVDEEGEAKGTRAEVIY